LNWACVFQCPQYAYSVANNCNYCSDTDCNHCVLSGGNSVCLNCDNSRNGKSQLGFKDYCIEREECPAGYFVNYNGSDTYCSPCGTGCDKCENATTCTHCQVFPTQYILNGNSCTTSACPSNPSSSVASYYPETYD